MLVTKPINWLKTRMWVLDLIKFVLILVLLGMAVSFNIKAAHQAAETKKIGDNTNTLVKSQNDILKAIKGVTDDTKMTAEQQTKIIICMLQVPVNQRTTDTEAGCRSQITQAIPAPAKASQPTSKSLGGQGGTTQGQVGPNNSPGNSGNTPAQPKKPNCTIDILFIHAGKCQ